MGEEYSIAKSTLYRYSKLYFLISDFPAILLSGFMITDLCKNDKKIREYANIDRELFEILKRPFQGIKSTFKIDDPSYDSTNDSTDLIKMDVE